MMTIHFDGQPLFGCPFILRAAAFFSLLGWLLGPKLLGNKLLGESVIRAATYCCRPYIYPKPFLPVEPGNHVPHLKDAPGRAVVWYSGQSDRVPQVCHWRKVRLKQPWTTFSRSAFSPISHRPEYAGTDRTAHAGNNCRQYSDTPHLYQLLQYHADHRTAKTGTAAGKRPLWQLGARED